ncbi:MAG: putative toxin-antitoxin system toxin component, PIN family [Methylophilaceae bacterium]
MLAVIDTNVLVSAMLTTDGTSAQVLGAIRQGKLEPVLSHDIFLEYVKVLNRPKFGFDQSQVASLLEDMTTLALFVKSPLRAMSNLPDPDDACFIAAALSAACPVITGNARDFPASTGVKILSPAEALTLL